MNQNKIFYAGILILILVFFFLLLMGNSGARAFSGDGASVAGGYGPFLVCRVWYSERFVSCQTYEPLTATATTKPKHKKQESDNTFLEAYPAPGDPTDPPEAYPAPGDPTRVVPTPTPYSYTPGPTSTPRPTPTLAPTMTTVPTQD